MMGQHLILYTQEKMRPRICMAIITSKPSGTIVSRESKEQIERGKRRASFEKNRKKLKSVMPQLIVPIELVSFNNGVAEAIAKFKRSKAS